MTKTDMPDEIYVTHRVLGGAGMYGPNEKYFGENVKVIKYIRADLAQIPLPDGGALDALQTKIINHLSAEGHADAAELIRKSSYTIRLTAKQAPEPKAREELCNCEPKTYAQEDYFVTECEHAIASAKSSGSSYAKWYCSKRRRVEQAPTRPNVTKQLVEALKGARHYVAKNVETGSDATGLFLSVIDEALAAAEKEGV